jgi:hypothetical protein
VNDNQSAVSGATHLAARDPLLFLYSLRASIAGEELNCEFSYTWNRRSDAGMVVADELSKPVDSGNIEWQRPHLEQIVLPFFGVRIEIDAMATAENAKAARFVSRYVQLGCENVDFLTNSACLDYRALSNHNVAWIYPPFFLLGKVIKIIRMNEIPCLLVHPTLSSKSQMDRSEWVWALRSLPVCKTLVVQIARDSTHIIRPGRGVPKKANIYPHIGSITISYIQFDGDRRVSRARKLLFM